MALTLLLLLVACIACIAHAAYKLPPLPFEPNATEPVIDGQTNLFHHDVHHAGYVRNLNAAVANYSDLNSLPLHELLGKVGTGQLPQTIETQVRNQGGGTWNHDLWWATIVPPNSSGTGTASISSSLDSAIKNSFGSTDAAIKVLQARAIAHFGSGWAWLVAQTDGKLTVTDTLNQDNPVMSIPGLTSRGIPILGIDVWEHSHYLKYGPNKTAYVNAFPAVVNWTRVSENYDNRLQPSKVIGEQYDRPS